MTWYSSRLPHFIGNLSLTELSETMLKINGQCSLTFTAHNFSGTVKSPTIIFHKEHYVVAWPTNEGTYMFDSFGIQHCRDLFGIFIKLGNEQIYQSIYSDKCGIFCLYVLQVLTNKKCWLLEDVHNAIASSFSQSHSDNDFNMTVYACNAQIGEEFHNPSAYPLTQMALQMANEVNKSRIL